MVGAYRGRAAASVERVVPLPLPRHDGEIAGVGAVRTGVDIQHEPRAPAAAGAHPWLVAGAAIVRHEHRITVIADQVVCGSICVRVEIRDRTRAVRGAAGDPQLPAFGTRTRGHDERAALRREHLARRKPSRDAVDRPGAVGRAVRGPQPATIVAIRGPEDRQPARQGSDGR